MLDDADTNRFDHLPRAAGLMSRLAYAQAKAGGIDPEPLLKKAGLTPYQIEHPHVRVPVRHQIKFLNLIAEALGDEFLGCHLAPIPDLRQVGLFYYCMASSDVLVEALQRGARYTSIVNEGLSARLIDRSEPRMQFNYVDVSRHLDRHQIEFWMMATVRLCRELTGLRLHPVRVRMVHIRERRCPELAEFLGDNVEFGAAVDEIAFAKGNGDLPIVGADPYLNNLLVKYCEEGLVRRQIHRGSFRARVENTIIPLLPHGKAKAAEIALRLGVSQRTLARRLATEGMTFSSLLERLRIDLAHRYLAEESLPISELAWLLGYQEVGAFSHAFKRWTGKSPRAARASVASPLSDAPPAPAPFLQSATS
jgi:AraC-like DNA-binding protein